MILISLRVTKETITLIKCGVMVRYLLTWVSATSLRKAGSLPIT